MSSLLSDITPVAEVVALKVTPAKLASSKRKSKPYEQIKTQAAVAMERKQEKKAAKAARKEGAIKPIAKASKPNNALSKAALKVAKRKAAVKSVTKQESKSSASSGICTFCGKPLSRHTSVAAGMGDTCAAKKLLLKGRSLDEHIAGLTVQDDPGKDYIPFQKAKQLATEKGVSGYRLVKAMGGERMLLKPINEHFKIILYKGQRYLPKSFLQHLKDAMPK